MKEVDKKLLGLIKKAALLDKRKRNDPRFRNAMGFFVAKGLLRTNEPVLLRPNIRLPLDDVIWAGQIEPRILEVLPAALVRLPQYFIYKRDKNLPLNELIKALRESRAEGPPLWGIPYAKFLRWLNFSLKDLRTKPFEHKRIVKTFRLRPEILKILKDQAKSSQKTETEILEDCLMQLKT